MSSHEWFDSIHFHDIRTVRTVLMYATDNVELTFPSTMYAHTYSQTTR